MRRTKGSAEWAFEGRHTAMLRMTPQSSPKAWIPPYLALDKPVSVDTLRQLRPHTHTCKAASATTTRGTWGMMGPHHPPGVLTLPVASRLTPRTMPAAPAGAPPAEPTHGLRQLLACVLPEQRGGAGAPPTLRLATWNLERFSIKASDTRLNAEKVQLRFTVCGSARGSVYLQGPGQ